MWGDRAPAFRPLGIMRDLESGISRNGDKLALPLFEIASVLVRLDHVAIFIENANHGIM